MEDTIIENYEEPIQKHRSRKKVAKNTCENLLENYSEQTVEPHYKNKLRVYVLSGQIKDLYGKIITENELNKMSETECENIYKICELNTAKKISDNVINGLVTVFGSLCSKVLPIDDKDKYTNDLKNDYIINAELKNVAGNIAMRTGRLMGLLSFLVITGSHISFYRKEHNKVLMQEVDNELDREHDQELNQVLTNELDK